MSGTVSNKQYRQILLSMEEYAEQFKQPKAEKIELPAFLYEDDGEIRIGYKDHIVVTDEWNEWTAKMLNKK